MELTELLQIQVVRDLIAVGISVTAGLAAKQIVDVAIAESEDEDGE